MPPASAVGVAGYLERLAASEPELAQQFSRGAPIHPPALAALRDGVYVAYYTNPAIWRRLGYTFRKGSTKTGALDLWTQLGSRVQRLPKMYRDAD
jgi:hypothetical protein